MKKILIVEDNSDYREILNLFITKMGYGAITAKNSYEAIAFAEAKGPTSFLWTCNCRMLTESTQPRCLNRIRKRLAFPVVALTGWMSALGEEKASKVGIVTYLIKPVSLQMLRETIEEYTHGSFTRGEV